MLAIFLDLETTGLDPRKHNVIDLAFKIIDVSSWELKCSLQSLVKLPPNLWENKDPLSIEFNGYTWDDVKKGKETDDIAKEIIQLFQKFNIERGTSVFICQNPSFDRSFFAHFIDVYTQEKLHWPYHWLDLASMYWAFITQKAMQEGKPFPDKINLSKNEIAKAYGLPPEANPHHAMNGVDHLILCYKAVLGISEKG